MWLLVITVFLIKSPQSGVTLCFQFVSASGSVSASAAVAAAMTFPSHVKTVWAKPWYLGQRKYKSEKMYWVTFLWPWPKVTTVALINKKFHCLQEKVRTTQPITTKLGSYIPLVMSIVWLDFGEILLETFWFFFCRIFFEYFGCVFSRSNTPLDISQQWLVWLMWNEKELHRMDTGWTMWPWPLTSPMTSTFDFSRSNFKIAVSQELIPDSCETKRKQIN